MKKIHKAQGTKDIELIECINPPLNKWRIRWNVQNNIGINEFGLPKTGINFMECEFLYKPSFDEIKELILTWHNDQISDRIKSGFTFKDMPVWLSLENQINYKDAYDWALQDPETNLPVSLRLGTVDYKFTTLIELTEFYKGLSNFRKNTLKDGRAVRDVIDWTPYQ